jgi:hypothetical protein
MWHIWKCLLHKNIFVAHKKYAPRIFFNFGSACNTRVPHNCSFLWRMWWMGAPQNLYGAHTGSSTTRERREFCVASAPMRHRKSKFGGACWYMRHWIPCGGPPLTVRGHNSVAHMAICATKVHLSVTHVGIFFPRLPFLLCKIQKK